MNSAAPWTIEIDAEVQKQLRRVPRKDSARILSAMAGFAVDPYSGDVVRMQGEEDVWRRRVGAYRIFFEVLARERKVYIFRVERRTSTTYR